MSPRCALVPKSPAHPHASPSPAPGRVAAPGARRPRRVARAVGLALAALFGLGAAAPAAAAAPCGGLRVADGLIAFGAPQRVADARTEAMEQCLDAVAKELLERPGVRSVTVAARVAGGEQERSAAALAAEHLVERLAARGLDRGRLSAVVPRAAPGEPDSLQIAFVERRSFRPVAQVWSASGKVLVGHQLGDLTPASPGTLLSPQQLIETGQGSVAVVFLLDGSRLRLSPDTVVRLGGISYSEPAGRNVHLELLRGYAEVRGAKREGPLRLVTGHAIAGVRGTVFRLALPEDKTTRLETTEGTVHFAGTRGTSFVTRGEGSRVDASGYPERVRSLLLEPRILEPLRGVRRMGDVLAWLPVPHADTYRVEFARTAQFDDAYWSVSTTRDRLLVSDAHTPGQWFWRVTAVDRDGFSGFSSKIYAFTVPAPGAPAP